MWCSGRATRWCILLDADVDMGSKRGRWASRRACTGMTRWLVVLLAITSAGCSSDRGAPETPERSPATSGGEAEVATEHTVQELLGIGFAHVQQRDCRRAIDEGFQPAIVLLERDLPRDTVVRGARAPGAASLLVLLTEAASEQQDTVVMGPMYSDALYFRAFCEMELGDIARAEATLNKALTIIPNDVVYSAELGHIYQQRGDQDAAIRTFRTALENAEMLKRTGAFAPSPEYPRGVPVFNGGTVDDLRCRALRGIGYSQFEQGDFAAAEQTYQQVLQINPNDEQALRELALIRERRGG